ncbi:MAG: glycosyltransferase family 4 protein [Deltaproteobacteria bacterium]|nr:glycosyltransferase family 4 protein [Deltaproteobacteria bacterium]
MKILFFPIAGREGASSRYRVYQYVPFLQQAGFQVQILPPLPRTGRGIRRWVQASLEHHAVIRQARNADLLFIQKRLFAPPTIRKMARLGKKIVFDLDDAIFTSPAGNWSLVTRRRVHSRLKAVMREADLVLCGNRYLKKFSSEWGASRTEILPTAIDTSSYSPRQVPRCGEPVLGWIGSSVNHRYLDLLSSVLPTLSREFQGLRLLVVSDGRYTMEGVHVENRPWSQKTEVRDILDMDVGLMPLTDNEWTRGKCALKALQYMAAGIPAVCSPVGANSEVVEDGKEGFLPQSDAEWLDSIRLLLNSHALREKMGKAGRAKVDAAFSLHVIAKRKIDLLRSV